VVRRVIQRALYVTGAVAASLALAAGLAPAAVAAPPARVSVAAPAAPDLAAPALAAPPLAAPAKPPAPTTVRITGKGLKGPLVVKAADDPQLFRSLLLQVNWLATATPQTTAPKPDKLGPKYTIVVFVKDAAQQTYDVYPLAAGGPRAFRPAKQPSGKKAAGWFYGRLTMSETLRLSGVPLPEKPDVISGGIGGGELVDAVEAEEAAGPGLDAFLGELRQLVLLNGAVVLLIGLGLAGISYLVRRRV
jgi:hypothetical protein